MRSISDRVDFLGVFFFGNFRFTLVDLTKLNRIKQLKLAANPATNTLQIQKINLANWWRGSVLKKWSDLSSKSLPNFSVCLKTSPHNNVYNININVRTNLNQTTVLCLHIEEIPIEIVCHSISSSFWLTATLSDIASKFVWPCWQLCQCFCHLENICAT